MKNKLVVWGTNAENEKVLIALELQADANKVLLYTFPEAAATDEFVEAMMKDWRAGKEVAFPENHTTLTRELSVTENLLPDDLKLERGDLIQRAQSEWHFVVLSSKLYAAYQQELTEFKEKVAGLSSYDAKLWDSLRAFWDKVQNQSRERNLFREHADQLRDNINVLFDDLKKMRARVNSEFNSASAGVYEEFIKGLEDIEARITAGGAKLNTVFDDLKQMQRRYRDARMSNEHRNKLWERLDGAFKKAKERKFGASANEGSVVERHDRRLGGLVDAIQRMEESVRRDEEDLNFQRKKVNDSEGQLEAQIRLAKIKMIEERLNSKRDKLAEMAQTKADVERQAHGAKEKEAKRAEKEAEKKQFAAAKEAARSEIAASIRSKTPNPEREESLLESVGTTIGDILLDALDTAKAVASVVADKAGDALQTAKGKASDIYEKASDVAGEAYEQAKEKAGDALEVAKDKAGDALDRAGNTLDVAKEKAGDVYEQVKEKAGELAGDVRETMSEVYEQAKEKIGALSEDGVASNDGQSTYIIMADQPEAPVNEPEGKPILPGQTPPNAPVTEKDEPTDEPVRDVEEPPVDPTGTTLPQNPLPGEPDNTEHAVGATLVVAHPEDDQAH